MNPRTRLIRLAAAFEDRREGVQADLDVLGQFALDDLGDRDTFRAQVADLKQRLAKLDTIRPEATGIISHLVETCPERAAYQPFSNPQRPVTPLDIGVDDDLPPRPRSPKASKKKKPSRPRAPAPARPRTKKKARAR